MSRPWFTLLPCATSDWMKLLLEESNEAIQEQSLRYLSAWLSVAGQAVGLKIPLELHCNSSVPSFFFFIFSLYVWYTVIEKESSHLILGDSGYTVALLTFCVDFYFHCIC